MIFGGSKKSENTVTRKIPCGVSPLLMYNDPPTDVIQFDEFASVALDRFSSIFS